MKTSRERKAREELPGRTVDEVWRAAWESCCLRSGVGRDDALADYLARIEHDARCPHPKCPGGSLCCCAGGES